MYEMRNNRLVEKKIKEIVKLDRARIQVNRISQFNFKPGVKKNDKYKFKYWGSSSP